MNKKLLTMITTGAIVVSSMSFAFAEIPNGGVPKGKTPVFDDEAVEPGDDIMDDVISGEEYEEEEIDEEVTDEDEPVDEEIIDEAEMERLEREEHEKELAEKEKAEEDDDIMDEIEKDAEKYDKENEEDTIGGIDDDYYDVGEEPDDKDVDIDVDKEEVDNKEATHNATTKDTNVSNDTTRAIGKSTPSKLKEYQRELEEPIKKSETQSNSSNPKTGDMGIIGSIMGMATAVGGIIFARKRF